MKKILLSFVALIASMSAFADETPTITFTADVDTFDRTLTFGMATTPGKLRIDWGDGNIVETEEIPVDDGWTTVNVFGRPVGTGVVKIYGGADLTTFEATSKVADDQPHITSLDVTNATNLTSLTVNGNRLTSIDLSKNTKLTSLTIGNNLLTALDITANTALKTVDATNNKLTTLDISKNTVLATLKLNDNNFETADFSASTSLKSLYIINNKLTSINLGNNTTLNYISVNNNLLTSLDLSAQTGLTNKASVFAIGNKLTSIKLPEGTVRTVNISNNCFTLATLPTTGITNLTYAPQKPMEISDINMTLDLSAQTNLKGLATEAKATTFTVYNAKGEALTAGTDYVETDGKISFINAAVDSAYVTMTTDAFPKFTGTSVFKTTVAKVVATTTSINYVNAAANDQKTIYNLAGQRLSAEPAKGIYIKAGKKYVK